MKLYRLSLVILIFLCIVAKPAISQYYYKDIWLLDQSNQQFKVLKSSGLRTIVIKSFEANGEASENFFCEKRINKNYTVSEMKSNSDITGKSVLTAYYNDKGLLTRSVDSTESATNYTDYRYDDAGRLKSISFHSHADDDSTARGEEHIYSYGTDGKIKSMIRKKMNILFSTIDFKTNEQGYVTDEAEKIKGQPTKFYYYYYDDTSRLTDVVYNNERLDQMLPCYMYRYDDQGQIDQLLATEEGGSNYTIWRYHYNDKKLRDAEKCYNKDKKLLGSIEYEYR